MSRKILVVEDSDDNRRILRDLFMKDMDKDEVCEQHGVSRDYLRVLVHRALQKFRRKYEDPDDS